MTWEQVLVICATAALTWLVQFIFNSMKYSGAKAIQKAREESDEHIRQIISSELAGLNNKIDLIAKGTQAELRHELKNLGDRWTQQGWCSIEDKADYDNMYYNYHALGKNGVMDSLHEQVMSLPNHAIDKEQGD